MMFVRIQVGRPTLWRVAANLLIAAGLGAVLYAVWFVWDGVSYQRAQRVEFAHALEETPAGVSEIESVTPAVVPGSRAVSRRRMRENSQSLAQLKIPSVDLDVMVGEGLEEQTLRRAAGHLTSSAKPGEPGNLVLLGHRDTFFRPLRGLQRGDIAEVQTTSGVFRYRIDVIKIVEPEHLDVRARTDGAEIMLVTCFPFSYVGPSPRRFVAQGRLIESGSE